MKIVGILILLIAGIGTFVLVKYYIFRLGKAVNQDISSSYYYHSMKNIIVYAPAGNWFELDYVELEADRNSFVPLAEEFGKDHAFIFWRGKKQAVEYATFSVDKEGIARDHLHVYSTLGYGKQLKAIEGADPKTYHRFDTGVECWNRYWNKDDRHYFYNDKLIDVDYNTFKRINATLAIDTNSIYAIVNTRPFDESNHIQAVVRKHINPHGTIKPINSDYALIGNSLIMSNWKTEFAIIPFTHINTIHSIDDRNIFINNQLVSDGKVYDEIDSATFTVLQRDYFKDKNQVYFDGQQIKDAQPETFEVVFEEYSKDNQHVFYKTEILNKASPRNFKYNFGTGEGTDGKLKFKNGKLISKN